MKHLEIKKNEVVGLIIQEIERLQVVKNENKLLKKDNSYTNKCIKKMFLNYDLLKQVDTDFIAENIEGVRGNDSIRDFNLHNIGSYLETAIVHLRTGKMRVAKAKSYQIDTKQGFMPYEIKVSMPGANCTQITAFDTPIIFVNRKGAFTIKKHFVKGLLNKHLRLENNTDYSNYEGVSLNHSLSQKLGLI